MTHPVHPFLADADRARAYQILSNRPSATTRSWAEEIGWTQTKLRTFIGKLIDHRLGELVSHGNYGSTFLPKRGELQRATANHSETGRVVGHLDKTSSASGLTASRYGVPPAEKKTADEVPIWVAGAEQLIEAVNVVMVQRFGASYKPIKRDNRGSHTAAATIASAGVPLDEAIELIRQQARLYTPDKTGGDLPRSLGHRFFAASVIRQWKIRERDREQYQLTLLSVEEGAPPPPPPPTTNQLPVTPNLVIEPVSPPIDPEVLRAILEG